ncbi:hypothetical protein HMPREF0400_00529 [Fusobacterium periodonticum 1_1_41FAA]|uniref:Fic protein n=1 Tax=Fusobacterium periodonticum 1_1_41FAA TaxID=469621 RepID=D6LFN2_9FUSO|nr:hypothetical protein HMPREF0400_00529 [Fusobacterium periodonticum 1_1_41FAA]
MQHFQCWCYSYPTSTCLTANTLTSARATSVLTHLIKFEKIHPFSDRNGRTGRLIMLALMLENRAKYMDILRNQDIENFVSLVEPLIEEEKKRIIAFKKSASLQI